MRSLSVRVIAGSLGTGLSFVKLLRALGHQFIVSRDLSRKIELCDVCVCCLALDCAG